MTRFVEDAPPQVLAVAEELLEKGVVESTAGSASALREVGTVCSTPSSLDPGEMTPEHLMVIVPSGEVDSRGRSPSIVRGARPLVGNHHLPDEADAGCSSVSECLATSS